jgi:hypothetical protein
MNSFMKKYQYPTPLNYIFKTLLLTITILLFLSCKNNDKRVVRERIEWSHKWIQPTDKNDLPKVLIIGDSHAERYYRVVNDLLNGIAYCSKYTSSLSLGDPFLPREIELLLEQYHFDVITFNNGLHGKGYTEKEYERYIPIMLKLFRKQKDTKLIWINTTPVRKRENLSEFADFNSRVITRNKIVKKYMSENQIPLVDFYSIGGEHPEYYTNDGVHFNKQGVQAEAELLTAAIKKQIENLKR